MTGQISVNSKQRAIRVPNPKEHAGNAEKQHGIYSRKEGEN